jgi:hypothetical protein
MIPIAAIIINAYLVVDFQYIHLTLFNLRLHRRAASAMRESLWDVYVVLCHTAIPPDRTQWITPVPTYHPTNPMNTYKLKQQRYNSITNK